PLRKGELDRPKADAIVAALTSVLPRTRLLKGAPVCGGGEVPRAIVMLGNRLVVVNQLAEVWAHEVGEGVGAPSPIAGARVCPGPQRPKGILALGGSRIGVVDARGELLVHEVGKEVGEPVRLAGARISPDEQPKALLFLGGRLLVVDQRGGVWAHEVGAR